MNHFRIAVANLLGMVVIFSLMAVLAISACTDSAAFRAEVCGKMVQGAISLPHSSHIDADKMPTPAPPRFDVQSEANNSVLSPSFGQPVYVQVKIDQAEIEVSWAPSDLLGR